jgi:two-component system chemotaxis response regulator CheB
VAIAASIGGPEALRTLLGALPADAPGIVVVQHMPAGFTAAFARSLDAQCAVTVSEARDGDAIEPGRVLIAPGGRHLVVHRWDGRYGVGIADGPLVARHRPSADVLFSSLASASGGDAVGLIMTGMGCDGAAGLAALHRAGGATLAQDEATSVVFGMAREAVAQGAVRAVLPLDRLADALLEAARAPRA